MHVGGDDLYEEWTLHIYLLLALPSPQVTTTMNSTVTAGGQQALECNVSVVPFLTVAPTLQWVAPSNSEVASGSSTSLTHTLDPVRTSDAGQYTCRATVDIPSVNVYVSGQSSTTLTVQSESLDTVGVACAHPPLLFSYSPFTLCDYLCQSFCSPFCWHWPHPHLYYLIELQCGH